MAMHQNGDYGFEREGLQESNALKKE